MGARPGAARAVAQRGAAAGGPTPRLRGGAGADALYRRGPSRSDSGAQEPEGVRGGAAGAAAPSQTSRCAIRKGGGGRGGGCACWKSGYASAGRVGAPTSCGCAPVYRSRKKRRPWSSRTCMRNAGTTSCMTGRDEGGVEQGRFAAKPHPADGGPGSGGAGRGHRPWWRRRGRRRAARCRSCG